jgi:myo-inositol-1(or 4)-monophosphatase
MSDGAEASADTWSPDRLLVLARDVAARAAAHILSARPEGRVTVAATKSSSTDPVTEIDRATERLIRREVSAVRPGDGFVGEEGGSQSGSSRVAWVVDPIDGTVNFVYGIPAYSVSIAVQVDGRVVAGVVRNVVSGEEYSAVLGGGARRTADGREVVLQVPDGAGLAGALLSTGFSYDAERRVEQAKAVAGLIGQVRDIRRFGSAALDLCSVADGRVDAYVERGLSSWDHSAGVLIVREAGGVVTGLDGGEPDERLLVAAGPRLHPQLREVVASAGF